MSLFWLVKFASPINLCDLVNWLLKVDTVLNAHTNDMIMQYSSKDHVYLDIILCGKLIG